MKCPNCKTNHERGIAYCPNCGSYIPGNTAVEQTSPPDLASTVQTVPKSKITKGLPLAIVGMILLEIAAVVVMSMQGALEGTSPDLAALQSSSFVWLLLSAAATVIGIISICNYKKAVSIGDRKPIPALVLGIIETATGAILATLALFILVLI